MTSHSPRAFPRSEIGILRASILVSLGVSGLGMGFGLVSGSFSILFDGVYSLVDASMSLLSLWVVRLITNYAQGALPPTKLSERFSMGFWHLEPMVLGLNGTLLVGVSLYALVTSVSSLLEGGRDLEFGWAVAYATVTTCVCAGFGLVERRANQRLQSEFIRLDVTGWIMSAGISLALLLAFIVGFALQGTRWQGVTPYIDPAILALVCVIIIPMPVATIRRAIADIFLVTPIELKADVDRIAAEITEREGFSTFRTYVARVGRMKNIEIYFIVPPELAYRSLQDWDALREEIAGAIEGEGPDRWIAILFTTDLAWAE